MKKKIGPLEAWQWGAIVLTIALAYYLYKKHSASTAAATLAATPAPTDQTGSPGTDSSAGPGSASTTDPNLIDQQTGQPYFGEINADINALTQGLAGLAAQENNNATAIENALGSLPSQLSPSAQPGFASTLPLIVSETSPNGKDLSKLMGHGSQKQTAKEKQQIAAQRRAKAVAEAIAKAGTAIGHGSIRNPGHIVTHSRNGASAATHHVGSTSISKRVAPAQHQRAPEPPKVYHPTPPIIDKRTGGVVAPHPAAPKPARKPPSHPAPHISLPPPIRKPAARKK